MRKYKVVEVKTKGLVMGRLNAARFQSLLNEHARDGWHFDRAVAGETRILDRDTLMIVFSQEVSSRDEFDALAVEEEIENYT